MTTELSNYIKFDIDKSIKNTSLEYTDRNFIPVTNVLDKKNKYGNIILMSTIIKSILIQRFPFDRMPKSITQVIEPMYIYNIPFFNCEKSIRKYDFNDLNKITREESLKKLENIRNLEDDWNDYGAKKLSLSLCDKVENILSEVIVSPKIFPTAKDSIQLEYYDRSNLSKYLEIEIFEEKIKIFQVLENGEELEFVYDNVNEINCSIRKFYGIT